MSPSQLPFSHEGGVKSALSLLPFMKKRGTNADQQFARGKLQRAGCSAPYAGGKSSLPVVTSARAAVASHHHWQEPRSESEQPRKSWMIGFARGSEQ